MKDRVFKATGEDGEDVTMVFRRPSQKVAAKADLVYREKYSDAFRRGFLLRAEVVKTMKERGLWDEDSEKEVDGFRADIALLEEKLSDVKLTNDQGLAVCGEIEKLRGKLVEASRIMSSVTDNTVENVADDERTQYLITECVYDNVTGLKVYKGVEDFKARAGEALASSCYNEAVIASLEVMLGKDLPSDLTTEYAEKVWMSERDFGEVTDDAEAEETPKPKKKTRTRKKVSKATKVS